MWTILAFFCLSIKSRIFFRTILACFSHYIKKWPILWTLFTSSWVLIKVRGFHRAEIWWQIWWVNEILTLTLISLLIKWSPIRTICTLMQISIIEWLIGWAESSIICSNALSRVDRIDWLTLWTWLACSVFCNSWPINWTLNPHTCAFIVVELLNSRAFNTLTLCIIIIPIAILITNPASGNPILIRQLTQTLLAFASRQVDEFTLFTKDTFLST